ncbi:unnamed protein product [Nippostrongylus brasiliensis]|uniref:Uncharacterized protein n=1 Tax=Nippostrongylus brasiliensis TaxID=27835 RepID=A0A0N4YIA3_NIPBR|nr:unnamed protein product [Nippostrongylus brasiliensis]
MRVGEEELESLNISELSAMEILRKTMMVNNDPVVERLLLALEKKIPNEYSAFYEKEKRMRSIVIAGIEELEGNPRPSERLSHLEDRVRDVLDALDVECKPCELYRMGSPSSHRPRLVKVVLPTVGHWRTALSNTRQLRDAGFRDVFVRRSMTAEERQRDYQLRQEARERNKGMSRKEWVVYKDALVKVSDLPNRQSGNSQVRTGHRD